MFIFGLLAALLGIVGLLNPETTLSLLNFNQIERSARAAGDYTLTFVIASSMASLNVGVYYILAALNDVQIFYRWTVPFRSLTFVLFTLAVVMQVAPAGFIGVAVWELVGAIATGLALWWERRQA
ncbi:MAG: hypothetical protein SGJ24_07335 [Chloroflexota bacterium]|nr:hypothetical protein [Chloroflexota bacterium]